MNNDQRQFRTHVTSKRQKNTCETAQFYAQNFKTRPLELNTVWESCLFSRSESSN